MLARMLDAALTLCIHNGSAAAADVETATGFTSGLVRDGLAMLARRGELLARPGGLYARPLKRRVRMPGESFPTDLRLPISALMGAR